MLKTIEKKVLELDERRKLEISDLEVSIEKHKKAMEQADNASADAYAKADLLGYHKAQDEHRAEYDAVCMLSDKLNNLKRQQYLTKAEYESMVSEIMGELDAVTAEGNKKLCGLIEQMKPIMEETEEAIKRGNELLTILQRDLYKDPKYLGTPEMARCSYEKRYRNHSVSDYASEQLGSYYYKNMKGEKG